MMNEHDVVAASIMGERLAHEAIAFVRKGCAHPDELAVAFGKISSGLPGDVFLAAARGFFRAVQKKLEQTV